MSPLKHADCAGNTTSSCGGRKGKRKQKRKRKGGNQLYENGRF